MQRLVEKIYREFSPCCKYIEIHVLDGNGGKSPSLSPHSEMILRNPPLLPFR